MKLATFREGGRTWVGRLEGERVVMIDRFTDVGEVLEKNALAEVESALGEDRPFAGLELAPVIPRPGKIICVGLNYRAHIREMGRELPEYPTLFTKYPESLIGAADQIQLPPESDAVDWEAELVVLVGNSVRRAEHDEAEAAIAGYTIMNDVTMRDWQYRTPMWFQGKAWENSTPLGPIFVTPEELAPDARLQTLVDGKLMQDVTIDDLVFDPAELIAYVSRIFTLEPGDIIATGTPGGVGHARSPQLYLRPGQVLTTRLEGIGELVNRVVAEPTDDQ